MLIFQTKFKSPIQLILIQMDLYINYHLVTSNLNFFIPVLLKTRLAILAQIYAYEIRTNFSFCICI